MATAIVTNIIGQGKSAPDTSSLVVTCYFFGDDVGENVEGQPFTAPVSLPRAYNLATLKADIANAVQGIASLLGLTVAGTDVDILSFETGV